jgi:hypothetical protein
MESDDGDGLEGSGGGADKSTRARPGRLFQRSVHESSNR